MTPEQHQFHTAPLASLVRDKLHKDVPFAKRVTRMRAKRWRDKLVAAETEAVQNTNENLDTNISNA